MFRDRIIPLIIAVALFMENMDSTVIATSLPAIAADIGTNPLALKLAVTSYLLSLAIFIPARLPTGLAPARCFAQRLRCSCSARLAARFRARSRISSLPASFKAWAER